VTGPRQAITPRDGKATPILAERGWHPEEKLMSTIPPDSSSHSDCVDEADDPTVGSAADAAATSASSDRRWQVGHDDTIRMCIKLIETGAAPARIGRLARSRALPPHLLKGHPF